MSDINYNLLLYKTRFRQEYVRITIFLNPQNTKNLGFLLLLFM